MSGGPVEPIPPEDMLGASDWGDEDLLTIAEASERLAHEIDAARRRIRHAEGVVGDQDPPAAMLSAERKRLAELMSAAERIRAARTCAPK
jgi:hypothetical protein